MRDTPDNLSKEVGSSKDVSSRVEATELRSLAEAIVGRLGRRRDMLFAAAAVLLGLIAFASLPAFGGILGFAALLVWCAVWPESGVSFSGKLSDGQPKVLTAQRRARQQMVTSLVHALPDAALVLDETGNVLAINDVAKELFGTGEVGRHITQTTRTPDLLEALEIATQTGHTQTCRADFKVPVERSLTGTVAPLPSTNHDEDAPTVLIVLRDLSEQDLLTRMRADFVANASHELRTPLASLKGFVETLQHAAKDDPVAREKFLKIMQQQADRMARLIDDLLSLSRIEMRVHVMPKTRIDINGLISHVVQTLQPIAQEKEINLNLSCDVDGTVMGDRDELIQVFQNLVENAIKYGRRGGNIEVRCSLVGGDGSKQGRLAVSVSDDGTGIAPEHLPRLTERFYRVNAAESRHIGGTGLGLAIVKHALTRHRADLQIESTLGKGSTFRVVFPIVD